MKEGFWHKLFRLSMASFDKGPLNIFHCQGEGYHSGHIGFQQQFRGRVSFKGFGWSLKVRRPRPYPQQPREFSLWFQNDAKGNFGTGIIAYFESGGFHPWLYVHRYRGDGNQTNLYVGMKR